MRYGLNGIDLGVLKLVFLVYGDDIVITSETEHGLHSNLKTLSWILLIYSLTLALYIKKEELLIVHLSLNVCCVMML